MFDEMIEKYHSTPEWSRRRDTACVRFARIVGAVEASPRSTIQSLLDASALLARVQVGRPRRATSGGSAPGAVQLGARGIGRTAIGRLAESASLSLVDVEWLTGGAALLAIADRQTDR